MSDTSHPLLPAATPLLRTGPPGTRGAGLQVGGVDSTDGVLIGADGELIGADGELIGADGGLVGADGVGLGVLLRGLDGRRSRRAVLAEADRAGFDPAEVSDVLDGLRSAGLLVDLDATDLLAADAGPAAAARAAVELPAALAPPGAGSWRARRAAVVVVDGATRVGAPLAAVLAASGVGRVSVRDTGLATAGDAVVGGLSAADEGRPRSVAAADAVRRANPLADLRPVPPGSAADLVVLARPWAASDPLAERMHRGGIPHLVATVRGQTGVVGPLVVPGVTSCLRCADLHRRDADPRWPAMAAQLTAGEPPPSGATVTCLLTAATAALQVLAYLDGSGSPATLGATVELPPPEHTPRLRRWPPHPACACGAATSGAAPREPTVVAAEPTPARASPDGEPPGGTPPRQATMGR